MEPADFWELIDTDGGVEELHQYLVDGNSLYYLDEGSAWSCLHKACEFQNKGLIRALVNAGFRLDYIPPSGSPAIFQALDADIDGALQEGEDADFATVSQLLSLGASSKLLDCEGMSLIDRAAEYGEVFKSELTSLLSI